jgi:transposase
MRIIAFDAHCVFAEAAAMQDGDYRRLGRIGMTRDPLLAFAAMLRPNDHVVVEATDPVSSLRDHGA